MTIPQPAMPAAEKRGAAPWLVPLLAGGFVAVVLGVYGRAHTPTGFAVGLSGFSGAQAMKSWLATGTFLLAIVQVVSAMAMYGKLRGVRAPSWTATLHRWSGRTAFLLSVPVAFHCLYALGAQFDVPRVLVHSLLGTFFYGVFVAKMLSLPKRDLPGWTLPVLGGLLFTTLTGLWLTSSFWFFTTFGIAL
ncbi:DUF6529 family protein [Sphaerisporangium sp. TRM90804]|uniref:DUF6529 family protein n=1 Tax=Sphaerisporangium sp. TRM90804 TaxID=3031113 RepID=UPI00244D62AA|nr:DUF6529 family protein [Sphaerisporangium sp. TRM90804]MDH2429851.1 DUF6529 family protein [Sphaerisporangium sp. TRM90804]